MQFKTSVTLSGSDVEADARQAAQPLRDHEVVYFSIDRSPNDLRAYYDAFVEALGTPVDIAEDYAKGGAPTGDRWSEIRYDAEIPDDVAFRHSKNAQPWHTDESYVSSPAGIMLFYGVNQAPSGGETNYVSGKSLVAALEADRPDLLEKLLTVHVRYQKAEDFKDRPILILDDAGNVDLNFNYYCAAAEQDEAALKLNQEFLDYLQADLPAEIMVSVPLGPGNAVSWRDDLVLHGRNAFEANKSGDRLIWKTGLILAA